jgi:hypothetical protein
MESSTIPANIWDAKKFHWKLILKGDISSLSGCPNWLYEKIRQIKDSGQSSDKDIQVISNKNFQYAIIILPDNKIVVYSKKR